MKVALSSDHRGYQAKEKVKALLINAGHEVEDFGSYEPGSFDYPDSAIPASQSVAKGRTSTAILICGTGIGNSIAANKVSGVRAAVCHDEITTELARKHNDANVLCMGADFLSEEVLHRMVRIWMDTQFEGGRHTRRVQKITEFENRNGQAH